MLLKKLDISTDYVILIENNKQKEFYLLMETSMTLI